MLVSTKQCQDEVMKLKIAECYEKFKGICGNQRVTSWLKRTQQLCINSPNIGNFAP